MILSRKKLQTSVSPPHNCVKSIFPSEKIPLIVRSRINVRVCGIFFVDDLVVMLADIIYSFFPSYQRLLRAPRVQTSRSLQWWDDLGMKNSINAAS